MVSKVIQEEAAPQTIIIDSTPTPQTPASSSPQVTQTTKKSNPTPTPDDEPWGVSKQISEHSWTMKVASDPNMATPSEILTALNTYRTKHGSQPLTMDPKLAAYAQSRTDYFDSIRNTDEHKGFNDFLENQDGFNKLGFTWLGENTSIGYQMTGTHLIEWIYAGDQPHDDNQLDNKWAYVGIGVKGTATCLIFGTGKM